jgi:glycosyltransferase involved in cell wall biosynthesis
LTDRIKVLRVIARLNVGGPALHVAYLTERLAERGYDTTLVAGTLTHGEESMSHVAAARGVQIRHLDDLQREISPLRDARAIFRLAREIRRARPTILHTHTAKAGAVGRIAALVAGGARPPIIVHTFHGHVLRGYFNPLVARGFRLLERLLAQVTTALVAVSPEVRDDLVRLGVAPEERFAVVRLGIGLEERVGGSNEGRLETRRLLGVAADAFVVGWVGRMTAIKSIDDVLRTFRRVLDEVDDAYLCIVGDGPSRETLERHAHQLGVMRRCLFVGYQHDVARFYEAIDALVLPSLNEGTPVSAIEALAARRPVVATNVGGVPDVVRDGVDGFLVPVGDTGALAARLVELARDPELREAMGSAGAARVYERYSIDRLVDDIDTLYRALISGKPARSALDDR